MIVNVTKEEVKKMTVKEMLKRLNICEDKIIKIVDKWGNELKKDDFCVDPQRNEIIVYTWG